MVYQIKLFLRMLIVGHMVSSQLHPDLLLQFLSEFKMMMMMMIAAKNFIYSSTTSPFYKETNA